MPQAEIQHTPGPWAFRESVDRADHPDISADVQGAHGEFVADCGSHEWANANARLIAAAPDLLAATKKALADHDEVMTVLRAAVERGADRFYISDMLQALVERRAPLVSAITKAEGR